jgi:hypothetical protein
MLSPRRIAQLGLSAACLTLVTSITVLVAGASDRKTSAQPATDGPAQVTPLATGQLDSMQSNLSQPIASAKQ